MVDINRYARHISLPDVGIEGQKLINQSRVLVVGAGGLGSPVLLYLAAAGIGEIGIIDDDIVDLSNLQRQVIHSESHIGIAKVESAKDRILSVNSAVKVTIWNERLSPDNAQKIFSGWDLIVDGTDNIPTRKYLVDDMSYNFIAFGTPFRGDAAIGGHFTYLNLGDQISTDDNGIELGTFSSYMYALNLSYAKQIDDSSSWGINGKYFYIQPLA